MYLFITIFKFPEALRRHKADIAANFYRTLQHLIDEDPECRELVTLLYYDGKIFVQNNSPLSLLPVHNNFFSGGFQMRKFLATLMIKAIMLSLFCKSFYLRVVQPSHNKYCAKFIFHYCYIFS